MEIHEIKREIKEAIAKVTQIEVEAIPDDAKFGEELEIDSLAVIETLVEVASIFQIDESREEELAALRTVNDIAEYVQNTQLVGKN